VGHHRSSMSARCTLHKIVAVGVHGFGGFGVGGQTASVGDRRDGVKRGRLGRL
jgi:hypothetical protein